MSSSTMYYPKISVVTINFNGATYLEETILSVCNQIYDNYEYIVIDGGSTDSSKSIINDYSSKIDKFISEPDNGIADAMNKGFEFSTGEYLLFIHSDDYLLSKFSLQEASKWLDKYHEIYSFRIKFGNELNSREFTPRGFNPWMNFKFGLLHQGVLCHRNVFEKIGNFDTQFKLAMDYDFFLRAYKNGVKLKRCDYTLSFMRDTGVSSKLDKNSLRTRFLEEKKAQYNNDPSLFLKALYPIYWKLYPIYRNVKM